MSMVELEDELKHLLQPYFKKWYDLTGERAHNLTITVRGEHGALYGSIYIQEEK